MIKRLRIGTKLLLVIALVVSIVFSITIYFLQRLYVEEIYARIYSNVELESEAVGNEVIAILNGRTQALQTFSTVVSNFVENDTLLENTIVHYLSQFPDILSVWYVLESGPSSTRSGIEFFRNDSGVITQRPLLSGTPNDVKYTQLIQSNQLGVGNPVSFNITSQNQSLTLGIPIGTPIQRVGTRVGYLGFTIGLTQIEEIILRVNPLDNGYAFLFANDTTYLSHPNPNQLGRLILDVRPDAIDRDADVRAGRRRIEELLSLATGELSYFLFRPIVPIPGSAPWSIVLTVSLTALTQGARTAITLIISLSILSLLVVITIIYLVLRFMIKPLGSVSKMLETIASGSANLTVRLPVKSQDEVGTLSKSFNKFIATLNSIMYKVQTSTKTMQTLGSDLSSNMTETSAAIEEITANIASVKNQIMNQSASVIETQSTVEQMVAHIQNLDSRIHEQASSVNESSASIEEMVANIKSVSSSLDRNSKTLTELIKSSETGKGDMREVSNSMNHIATESEGLLEANSVIQNIAAQTNLLAMNAAIEAAHAGEAGKGFAVVAGEIRKLAETSSIQSNAISTLLKNLKELIDKVVGKTSQALVSYDHIMRDIDSVNNQEQEIKHAMDEQDTGSTQVLEALEQINTITSVIQNSSSELLVSSQTILDEMERLSSMTQEVSQSMDEMATGANQITSATTEVVQLSLSNKEKILEVDELASSFIVNDEDNEDLD
jgi:methyl-accepting chemotaxis protein